MGWVCVIQNINTDSCNKHPEHEAEDPFSGGVKGGGCSASPAMGLWVCGTKLYKMLSRREYELRAALMQCLLFQDEECLRPGEATDLSFLEKLEEKVGDHAHFVTYAFTLCIFPSHIQGWAGNNLCLVPEGIKQPIQMLESSTGGSGVLGGVSGAFSSPV